MDLSHKKSFLQICIYKKSNYIRTPLGPVKPVKPTGGQTGRAPARQITVLDWSDRLFRPVTINFDRQHTEMAMRSNPRTQT